MFAKKIKLSLIAMAIMLFGQSPLVLAQSEAYVYGTDTVAGQPAYLRVRNFASDSPVNFIVNKPDQVNVTISSQTDEDGNAEIELYDYHTRISGQYFVKAVSPENGVTTSKTSFNVIPAALDGALSEINVNKTVVGMENDNANITVTLLDKYTNPIPGRTVKLLSSRNTDKISSVTDTTDSSGQQKFSVSSSIAGISAIMAIDIAEGKVLDQRTSLSFRSGVNYISNAGGDFINKAYAADFGALNGFEISGLPDTIKKNENVSFTVKAIDQDSLTVQDYTGTVRFSAEGDNSSGVTLPANYKFLASDLGQHNFDLGLSFAQDGTYKLVVNDLTDKFKKGEATIVVGSASGTKTEGTGSKPVISAPAPGTYSQAEMTVSGSAKTGSSIQIFDNDQKIGEVPVGPSGKFSYQTKPLEDGKHRLYVVNTDQITLEVIGTSDPVDIEIDTTPPLLESVELDPSTGIKPGSVINVKVFSEKNLTQASIILNFDIVALNVSPEDQTLYIGTLQAPADPGIYKMNILLQDEMQNEKTYEDQATITVDEAGGTIVTPQDTTTTTTTTQSDTENPPTDDGQILPVAGAPSQVSGLIAYGSDKRVTLVWDAATDDKMVKSYKVYFGDDVKNLDKVAMTKDASTTWYIPELVNGKEYFFAVAAIDDEANESTAKSEIVSGIPFMLEIKNALSEGPTSPIEVPDNLKPAAYSGPFPTNTTKTGPEVLLVLGASAAIGTLLKKKRK